MWPSAIYICGGTAARWRLDEWFDVLAADMLAVARGRAGCLAISGEHFWNELEKYCYDTPAGHKQWLHHGVARARRGEDQPTLANPLIWERMKWFQKCIQLCLEIQPHQGAEMVRVTKLSTGPSTQESSLRARPSFVSHLSLRAWCRGAARGSCSIWR